MRLAAARLAAIDLATEQRTSSGAEHGAGGAFTTRIDRASGQGAGSGADDQPGRTVRATAVIAAVLALPVPRATIAGVLARLIGLLGALAVGRRPGRRIGEHRCGGNGKAERGNGENGFIHGSTVPGLFMPGLHRPACRNRS